MKDLTTLVLGGTGDVGEGIVRSFLKHGASVIASSRTQTKLDALRDYVGDIATGTLKGAMGSLDTPEAAEALRDRIGELASRIDVIVAVLGGWSQGFPITGVGFDQWQGIVRNNLTTHFLAMKTFVPLLAPERGIYVHINGQSAEGPHPGAGPVAAMSAAQRSLATTLAEELRPSGMKVHELLMPPINTRRRINHHHDRPEWPSPEEIGDYIAHLIGTDDREVVHWIEPKKG
ncbi:SDR family NAD(P)-dependent oxidoreductase [Paracoccus spongiarum]|uniref:SDR family oxidoreductase n=1 Tax=Paracoccus spongiarum TaxID=3064387 RepID=A0ABT9J8Z9_9RHOB|nr:SDR family oxidoreductase [Paracoccus sp. 2205BS29-5]MDP5306281.1 SDR family oxidoreductase [Paracoccus sp. 2205BS29-5]